MEELVLDRVECLREGESEKKDTCDKDTDCSMSIVPSSPDFAVSGFKNSKVDFFCKHPDNH